MSKKTDLIIVGYSAEYHIGSHLLKAAQAMQLNTYLWDASSAFDAHRFIRQINWRLCGHRPPRLKEFSRSLVALCETYRPDVVLVTGITPPDHETLTQIKGMGIRCINYLTDDPWNSAHYAPWFLKALPFYNVVFTPRTANLKELNTVGCKACYLPFGYAPDVHYYEAPPLEKSEEFESDVLFYGGADRDRLPYIQAILGIGLKLHVYGGFWERYNIPRSIIRGHSTVQTLRWAVAKARVTLCLVRRANRDGHVMRTYEASAMGACMLVEDTLEHREIFGGEGNNVIYFNSIEEMASKLKALVADARECQRLAYNVHQHIVTGKNTYQDRLVKMLNYSVND